MSLVSEKIATIINFCSNDYPFLKHCIEKVKPFSSQVIVPVCDHFFDGTPEDLAQLNHIYAEHPDVEFVQYPFDKNRLPFAFFGTAYWHNIARLVAAYHLNEEIQYVLFLDTDEIVDTNRFSAWINQGGHLQQKLARFAVYWYFREPIYQALTWEEVPVLICKSALNGELLMRANERWGMFDGMKQSRVAMKTGLDQLPLIHHYSYVRTKEQMLKKVTTWSHSRDRDWVPMVEKEFEEEFRGTDFVNQYTFKTVEPFVALDLSCRPAGSSTAAPPNVRILTPSDVYKIEIALTFDL